MQLKEQVVGDVIILSLSGSLHTESDAAILRERIYGHVENNHIRIVFDLAELRYINSWGLGLLVALLSMMRRLGGDLRLARLGDHVHDLFIVTQLSKVFQTYEGVDEAVGSFR